MVHSPGYPTDNNRQPDREERSWEKQRGSQRGSWDEEAPRLGKRDLYIRCSNTKYNNYFNLTEDCPSIPDEIDEMKNMPFCEALGSLMWSQVATRPDLAYSINKLACFAHNPGKTHWNALKHMLAYVKGTMDYGIMSYDGKYPINNIISFLFYIITNFSILNSCCLLL